MSKIGQANLAKTEDDMGEEQFELIMDEKLSAYEVEEQHQAQRLHTLSTEYKDYELLNELFKRGYDTLGLKRRG